MAVCDRLDNVANYSQLLRSFGELSCELVDLGHCIMFSKHCRARDAIFERHVSSGARQSPQVQVQVRPSASASSIQDFAGQPQSARSKSPAPYELVHQQHRYGLPALRESQLLSHDEDIEHEEELLAASSREAQRRAFLSWPPSGLHLAKPKVSWIGRPNSITLSWTRPP